MIVYRLISPSGKSYVGMTTDSLRQRVWEHNYKATKGKNTKLYAAIRKYGIDSFKQEVLYEAITLEELKDKEVYYIAQFDSFNAGYNSTLGGDGTVGKTPWNKDLKGYMSGDKNPSKRPEHRKKMKENNPAKWNRSREKISRKKIEFYINNPTASSGANNAMFGKQHSSETKLKQSLKRKEWWAQRKAGCEI